MKKIDILTKLEDALHDLSFLNCHIEGDKLLPAIKDIRGVINQLIENTLTLKL